MADPPPAKKRRVADLLCSDQAGEADVVPDVEATILTADGSWAAAEAITKQMPAEQVPLTILTGFLGAGKSTVLNYILSSNHGLRIAVLINEFGDVDIDNQLVDTKAEGAEGDPIQLNNGCVCCTISNGFIDAVQKILDRPGEKPHYFILETSGVADPKPIIDSVSNTELREDLYVDQVLTVIDSSSWTAEHYDSETAAKQLQFADTVLLSKTDLVQEKKLQEALENILEIRPNTRILKSQKGYVPIAALFDLDVAARIAANSKNRVDNATADGKQAVENGDEKGEAKTSAQEDVNKDVNKENGKRTSKAEDKKEGEVKPNQTDEGNTKKEGEHAKDKSSCGHKHAPGEKCGHSHDHDHHPHHEEKKKKNHLEQEGFTSLSFVSKQSFSLNRFRLKFMEELPPGVFRAKGLLWFRNYSSRFVFHWSGQRFNVEEDEWPEGVTPSNQLVIIGRNLDKAYIHQMLENCISRPDDEDEDFDDLEDDEDLYPEEDMEDDYDEQGLAYQGIHDPTGIPIQPGMAPLAAAGGIPNGIQPHLPRGPDGASLEPIPGLQTPLPALTAPIPGVGPALMPHTSDRTLPSISQDLPQQAPIELAALQNAPPQNPANFSLPHISSMPAMNAGAHVSALDGSGAMLPGLNGGNIPNIDGGGKLPALAPIPAAPAAAVAEPAVEASLAPNSDMPQPASGGSNA